MKTSLTATLFLAILLCGVMPMTGQYSADFGASGSRGLPIPPKDPNKVLEEKLDKKVTIEIDENTVFEELFDMIKEKADIQCHLDPRGAGALGITLSSPVVREPFKMEDVPLRTILRLMLIEQDLAFAPDEGILIITSEDESKLFWAMLTTTKFYFVGDLVQPTFPVKDRKEYHEEIHDNMIDLMDFLENLASTESEFWDDMGLVTAYGGKILAVRKLESDHKIFERLLKEMRSELEKQKRNEKAAKPKIEPEEKSPFLNPSRKRIKPLLPEPLPSHFGDRFSFDSE